jgi:hypothetical protein
VKIIIRVKIIIYIYVGIFLVFLLGYLQFPGEVGVEGSECDDEEG